MSDPNRDATVVRCGDHVFKTMHAPPRQVLPSGVVVSSRATKYNIEYLKAVVVGDLSGLHVTKELHNTVVLCYPYIAGSHMASSSAQFLDIADGLMTLHNVGQCHGDVRGANMVFGKRSHLIDYDLTAPFGSLYPLGYRVSLVDGARAPGVGPGVAMLPAHDWAALAAIMRQYRCSDVQSQEAWVRLCEGVAKGLNRDQLRALRKQQPLPLTATNMDVPECFEAVTGSSPSSKPTKGGPQTAMPSIGEVDERLKKLAVGPAKSETTGHSPHATWPLCEATLRRGPRI
eukprot:m.33676 g.33676  ORF g.33676 m.33676 type:complete len:287 (-) comp5132_c0_seq1:152-1012(-)